MKLEKIMRKNVKDIELQEHLKQLQQPVRYKDKVLGTLQLDRSIDWYSGRTKWNGKAMDVNLSAKKPEELQQSLAAAHTLWANQKKWTKRVGDYAIQKLLDLKNGSWLEDEQPKVTKAQFLKCMTLTSITVEPDGSFDFWHDDGDLFWGHSIQIHGNLANGLTRADIPG